MVTAFLLSSLLTSPVVDASQPSQAAGALHTKIHCPAPESIEITAIPSSFHTVLSATSAEGVKFGSFGTLIGKPADFAIYGAEISEINGYYRLACGYQKGSLGFTLSTRDDLAYSQCYFEGGAKVCEGDGEACVLICPSEAFPELGEPAVISR